jgi:ABC-2 type transport system permease protein
LPWSTLPGFVLTLIIGMASACCVAFALAAIAPSASAASAIANLIVLPVCFMSGLFARNDVIPGGVARVASALPVKPLFTSLVQAFDPMTSGSGVDLTNLAIVAAAWGVAGLSLRCASSSGSRRGARDAGGILGASACS